MVNFIFVAVIEVTVEAFSVLQHCRNINIKILRYYTISADIKILHVVCTYLMIFI